MVIGRGEELSGYAATGYGGEIAGRSGNVDLDGIKVIRQVGQQVLIEFFAVSREPTAKAALMVGLFGLVFFRQNPNKDRFRFLVEKLHDVVERHGAVCRKHLVRDQGKRILCRKEIHGVRGRRAYGTWLLSEGLAVVGRGDVGRTVLAPVIAGRTGRVIAESVPLEIAPFSIVPIIATIA